MANQQCDMAFVPDNPMCFGLHDLRTLLHPQFEDSMIFKQCSKMTNLDVNVGSPWLGKLIQVPILGKQASHLIYIHIYIYTYIYIYIHTYIYIYIYIYVDMYFFFSSADESSSCLYVQACGSPHTGW